MRLKNKGTTLWFILYYCMGGTCPVSEDHASLLVDYYIHEPGSLAGLMIVQHEKGVTVGASLRQNKTRLAVYRWLWASGFAWLSQVSLPG